MLLRMRKFIGVGISLSKVLSKLDSDAVEKYLESSDPRRLKSWIKVLDDLLEDEEIRKALSARLRAMAEFNRNLNEALPPEVVGKSLVLDERVKKSFASLLSRTDPDFLLTVEAILGKAVGTFIRKLLESDEARKHFATLVENWGNLSRKLGELTPK